MNSFSFLLIIIAMGVTIYWYVMNIELSKDGNSGLFAMVDEIDDGETVRMRELLKTNARSAQGRYAAGVRHKLAILTRQHPLHALEVKLDGAINTPPVVATAASQEPQLTLAPKGMNGVTPLRGVDHQPNTMRARVHAAPPRSAREKVQEKMKQPNAMSPDEEKAAILEYERIIAEREGKSLAQVAKGIDARIATREATVFAARVTNKLNGKDDFYGSTLTPDHKPSKTVTSKAKYKKRDKTSSAYCYKKSKPN